MEDKQKILSAQLKIEPCHKLPGVWEVFIDYHRKTEFYTEHFQGSFYVPDSFLDDLTALAESKSVL